MFVIGVILVGMVILVLVKTMIPALLGIFGGGSAASTVNNFVRMTDWIEKVDADTVKTAPIYLDPDTVLIAFNDDIFTRDEDWKCQGYDAGRLLLKKSDSPLKRPDTCYGQPCLCICRDAGSKIESEDCQSEDSKCVIFEDYTFENRIVTDNLGCSHGVFIPGNNRASGQDSGIIYFYKDDANDIIYIDDADSEGYVEKEYETLDRQSLP